MTMAEKTDLQRLVEWLDRDDPSWGEFLEIGRPWWPPYRDETELARIRDESRWFATHHPFAIAALEVRASYVVGCGHTYSVRAKPNVSLDVPTLEAIEAEITQFLETNQWQHRQIENQIRLDRDGEVFIRLFESNGQLLVRYVEPEQVSAPLGSSDLFGVITHPLDAETVVGYWVAEDPTRLTDRTGIPASEIQHRKANVDGKLPRGLPLLYGVRANLRRVWKLLRNMTTVASIQAAVAIVRQHGAAPAGSVQQYVQRMQSVAQNPAEQQPNTYERFPPGAIVDVAPGVEVKFPAEGINVANYVAAIQAELRAVAARLAMPEYMLSGDASNANYSSTLVAEGPAVKMFERLQSQTIWWDTQILMRALQVAERAGRLPEGISQQIVIDAEAPITQIRNRLQEAQADQILLTMGIVSPQTIAARHGFNYQQERDLIAQAGE